MGRKPSLEKKIKDEITAKVKQANTLAAKDIAKDIKKIHNSAVKSWYNSYRPREYERQYRLYSDATITEGRTYGTDAKAHAEIRVKPENITGVPYTNWKGRRVGRSVIFGITEIGGRHGCRGGSADTSPKALTEKMMDEYDAKKTAQERILKRLQEVFNG